ncbi:purine permease YgfU [Escherichia coli]|nr:purine permease YgfU [Escherichia marmotae]EFO1594000.1 purine permease YgfU [Escherichia coli]
MITSAFPFYNSLSSLKLASHEHVIRQFY